MNLCLALCCWSVFLIQVNVGPFTVVQSIDRLTIALADLLSVKQQSFALSTNSIGNEFILF